MRHLLLRLAACSSAPEPPQAPIEVPVVVTKDLFEGINPKCRGANLVFDTWESEAECVTDEQVADPKAPAGLAITAEVLEKTVKVGGRITVVVKMTNTTAAPMQVYVDLTCDDVPGVPLQIFDTAGKRADWTPHKNCIRHAPPNCERHVLRIVLEPGGSMTKKREHLALWQKASAECGVSFGTLAAGRYVVRVMSGFYRAADRALEEATLVVQ